MSYIIFMSVSWTNRHRQVALAGSKPASTEPGHKASSLMSSIRDTVPAGWRCITNSGSILFGPEQCSSKSLEALSAGGETWLCLLFCPQPAQTRSIRASETTFLTNSHSPSVKMPAASHLCADAGPRGPARNHE